ncbi:MAG: hypothetical protein K2Q22_03180, partial [Cytophagales bacterium]|nr:hypothetical protein [Cytophagales bacterium]
MKYLLLTFLILYILYKLSGFLLRSFLRVQVNKFERNYGQQQTYSQSQRQEGNIFINPNTQKAPKKPKKNDLDGDYVDYEIV